MKRFILILLVIVFIFSIGCQAFAFGDPGSATLGAAIYGMMNGYGLNFIFSGMSANAAKEWINTEVNKYSGGSPEDYFSPDLITAVAGKLIIPALVVSQINDFIQDRISEWGLTAEQKQLYYTIGGLPVAVPPATASTNIWAVSDLPTTQQDGFWLNVSSNYRQLYYGNNAVGNSIGLARDTDAVYGAAWFLDNSGYTKWGVATHQKSWVGQETHYYYFRSAFLTDYGSQIFAQSDRNDVKADLGTYDGVWSIGDDKVISIGSQDWSADTNLDQIIGDIYTGTADNDIDIDMEETDVPVPPTPAPTPAPIEPDTPLQDVPWEGLNDLLDLTNGSLDDINNEIINAGQGIDNISGQLDNIGTQIGEQTTSISGALDQAATDTVEAIEGTTAAVNDIADILTPQDVDEKTFDLRELFPFCIPFDIYHLLQKFDGTPTAPHVQLPIVIPSIGFSYTMDLDFSAWNPVAAAMRTVELIVYALGLAWATSKVIKW